MVSRIARKRPLWGSILAAGLSASLALGPISTAHAQEGGMALIRDTEIEAILREDLDPILLAAGLKPEAVQLHLVNDKSLNAGAAAQHMFLNTGLIIETKTPNELAGVMAHETGHIAGGHSARSGQATKGALAPFFITMGLGLLAAFAGAPDAAGALIYSSNYFATLSVLGYSRVQEAAADQAAATYLERAGESGKGLVEFFNNFRYQEVFSDDKKFPFFRSHPLSSDRIEALKVRVQEQPHYGATDSPEAQLKHEIMVAKLKGFMNPPEQTLYIDYPDTNTSFTARYARAIALYKATDTEKALKATDALIADQPDNPYLWELKGQILFETGRAKEAEADYQKAVALKPDAPLLRMALGQTLLALDDDKRLDEAIDQLQRAGGREQDNAFAWRLLSEAYDRKGEAGMARWATAEQNFALGQMRDAKVFAMRARELLPKNTPQWRRATDIALAAGPKDRDTRDIATDDGPAPSS